MTTEYTREGNRRRNRAYRERHKDRLRESDREKSRRWYHNNIEKARLAQREHKRRTYATNKEKIRWAKIMSAYGLTKQQFEELLAKQGGTCAGCDTSEPGGRGWQVDHCHGTGRVRGILCSKCNTGIGLANDDPEVLGRWIEYLRCYPRE